MSAPGWAEVFSHRVLQEVSAELADIARAASDPVASTSPAAPWAVMLPSSQQKAWLLCGVFWHNSWQLFYSSYLQPHPSSDGLGQPWHRCDLFLCSFSLQASTKVCCCLCHKLSTLWEWSGVYRSCQMWEVSSRALKPTFKCRCLSVQYLTPYSMSK